MDFSGAMEILRGEDNARINAFTRTLMGLSGGSEWLFEQLSETPELAALAFFERAKLLGQVITDSKEGVDYLTGHADVTDVFDADTGGDDVLRGLSDDDVYYLGYGTGHDTIDEGYSNRDGDDGDVIRLKAEIDLSNVQLGRNTNDRQNPCR